MHGKFLISTCLLAILASVVCAEEAAHVIEKPTSVPAVKEDLSQKSLADVVVAMDGKNWARAKKILSAILPANRKNPKYYLAYGCVYVGAGHDTPASTALRRAVHLDKKYAPAHAALGLCYIRMGKSDLAASAFATAELELGSDRVYQYSRAVGYGMTGDWGRAEKIFEKLTNVSEDAKPDDVAILAAERLKEISVFRKNILPLIAQQEKELADEHTQKKQLEREIEKFNEKLLEIEDEKELLQENYDEDVDSIKDTYEDARDRVEDQYNRDRPPSGLASSDPATYSREVHNANRTRARAFRRIKQLRKDALNRLKRNVGPKVRNIKKRIRTTKKELAGLARDITAKEKEIKKLQLTIEKFQIGHKPFDVEKHSRDVTIRLARKEISDSAPKLPQPTTQPGEKMKNPQVEVLSP